MSISDLVYRPAEDTSTYQIMPYRPGTDAVVIETLPYVRGESAQELANEFLNAFINQQQDVAGYIPWGGADDFNVTENPEAAVRLQRWLDQRPGWDQRREELRQKYRNMLKGV